MGSSSSDQIGSNGAFFVLQFLGFGFDKEPPDFSIIRAILSDIPAVAADTT